jgi:hypothetical protein
MHECKDERQILATSTADTTDIDSDVSTEEKEINDDDSFRIESRFKDPLSNTQIEEAKGDVELIYFK